MTETENDTGGDSSDSSDSSPLKSLLQRTASWTLRIILLALAFQALAGLLEAAQPGDSPGDLFARLIHGDLKTLFLAFHAPGEVLAGLGKAIPLTMFAVALLAAAVTGVVLFLRLSAVVGLALGVTLLAMTLRTTEAHLWEDLTRANVYLLVLGFFCFGAVIFVTVVRWGLLLQVQGVHLPLWVLVRLTLIGVFFNLAIPGAVGGDLVKMGYIARKAPERKAEAMLTIFLDRVLGMLGLFVVAAVAVLFTLPIILGLGDKFRPIQIGALLVALGSIAGIAGLLLVEFRSKLVERTWIGKVVAFADNLLPEAITDVIRRLVEAVELYRDSRLVVLKAVLLGVLVHTLLGIDLFCLGKALGESELGVQHYMVAAAVANTGASIPVTPGGMGTRDAIVAAFFTAFKAKPADVIGSIPVTMSLLIVVWGIVGAVVFVFSPRASISEAEELTEPGTADPDTPDQEQKDA